MKLISNAREQAQEALKQMQATMIKETRFKEFEIGQKVWLEGKNIKRPYDSPKLSPKRYGPFRVVAKISPVAYKLQIPAMWQVHDVFHASLLTPYKETVEHGKNFLEPPPDIIEGEEEWEVEQILDKRIFGRSKKLQFLVRWKGYSPAHDQWVNKEDMAADDLVRIFERVTIPAVTPTFSSTSRPAASPEVPRDASSGHVPLGSHVIHPRAPLSRPMPRDPVSRPRWVRLRESPPSTPDAPDEPESSTDPRIDSAVLTEDLSILQGLLSGLPMSLWSAVPDMTDGH